ncbi:transcription antitermination factor NusB [soil metagenome]
MSLPEPLPRRKPRSGEEVAIRKHQARVIALQVLFEVDVTDHPVTDVLPRALEEQEATEQIAEHASRLIEGVLQESAALDARIAIAAPAFPVDQMPAVDRNVLRVATYELLLESAVPPKVAINEAVEIAKRYGGPNASKFVNGALRTILQQIEQDRAVIADAKSDE